MPTEPTPSKLVFSRVPYLGSPGELGPFYRLQCPHVNELMCESGRIGGGPSYGVGFTRVHAFVGALPDHLGGIEFWTAVEPYRYSPKGLAYWNLGDPGVEPMKVGDRTLASIAATIVKRLDSYAYCRSCES